MRGIKLSILVIALTGASQVRAQFYSPETKFHDLAQRTFPVEAARVLAAQRNAASGGKIAEITYKVETTPERETVWNLRWLDEAKKPIREKTVRYPESLLDEGPKYFREVFKQIASEDWAIESAPPDNAATAFWQGAEQAGVARLEAVSAAGRLLAEKPKITRPADATRLGAILLHGAIPSISTRCTLDGALLSRGAAWICTAEALAREPLEAAWPPLLFLAGREPAAQALWQKLPAKAPEKRKAADRFWDFLLRGPAAKDCFLFASRPENRAFALPAMLYAQPFVGDASGPLAEIAGEILGNDLPARLYDYAPSLAGSDIAWSKQMSKAATAAWDAALRNFSPTPFDFAGYRAALVDAPTGSPPPALLKMSAEERTGPLVPVMHVTARDLLGFGWEATQPASRMRGVTTRKPPALSREEAQAIAESVRAERLRTANAEAKEASDPTAFKNADEFWTHLESIRERSAKSDRTSAAVAESMRKWLNAARAFIKTYPQDARRWEAKAIAITVQMQLAQLPGGDPDSAAPDPKEVASILEAPDATPAARGEAAYLQVVLKLRDAQPNAPHTFPPFHQAVEEFLTTYATHARAPEVANMQMQLLQARDQPGAHNLLRKLAAHPNLQIAGAAKENLTNRERMAKLRTKPLHLKVPTTDGKEIDFAKLRGKVVLLDFWASWCGPCIAELPNVVKTYEALHSKGFEIVGISLDQDREAMDAALKKHKVAWPQHFDGTGWKNQFAQQFGIRGIPAAWLFDKKGILRETELRGEELQAAVEKLLRE